MSVTSPPTADGNQRLYFYVSHAHSTTRDGNADPNHWVGVVFRDIAASVQAKAQPLPDWDFGYADLDGEPSDPSGDAIRRANAFLPFYSDFYLTSPVPEAERTAFQAHIDADGEGYPRRSVVPVLWIPLADGYDVPELSAALVDDSDLSEYVERGLEGLCRLSAYRSSYVTLIDRLGGRIVKAAEGTDPEPPAPAPPPIVEPRTQVHIQLTVGVLAPTVADLPTGRDNECYGDEPVAWQPFVHGPDTGAARSPGRSVDRSWRPRLGALQGPSSAGVPAARHVADASLRTGWPAAVVNVVDLAALRPPGLVLVDPWMLQSPDGHEALRETVQRLGDWIELVILISEDDPQYGRGVDLMITEVQDMAQRYQRPRPRVIRNVQAFEQSTASMVADAWRAYMRLSG